MRGFLLEGVGGNDGRLSFYPVNEYSGRSRVGSRVWRLKVGSSPLPIDSLQMSGGGEVVGSIPCGLPAFSLPEFDFRVMMHLLPFVAIISLLGFLEAISVAKAMAAKTGRFENTDSKD
jgi:MFS superfamily sulfate permease-like transporter